MDSALITALFGVLIVGASQVAESSMKRGSNARLAEFTGQFTRELLVLNPVAATSAG